MLEAPQQWAHYFEGLSYIEGHILGNYKEAIELSLQGLSIDSNDTRLLGNMGKFLMYLEQYDESLKYYEKLLEHLPKGGDVPQGFLHRVAFVYQMNGFEAEANYYFDRLISECNRSIELGRRYSASEAYYDLASTYALKGERAEAYKNLNMFVNSGQNARYFITLLKDDPFFDKLRDEAEFQNILKDMEAASMVERQKIREWLEENNL
jgi:tetratricopeptide (TPR) repeat protein